MEGEDGSGEDKVPAVDTSHMSSMPEHLVFRWNEGEMNNHDGHIRSNGSQSRFVMTR